MNRTLALALLLSLAAASSAQFVYRGRGELEGINNAGYGYQFSPDPFAEGTRYASVATGQVFFSEDQGFGSGYADSGVSLVRDLPGAAFAFSYDGGRYAGIADATGRPAGYALIDGTQGNAVGATNLGTVFSQDSHTLVSRDLNMGGHSVMGFTAPGVAGAFGFTTTSARAGVYDGSGAFLLEQGGYAASSVDGGTNPTGFLSYAVGHVSDGRGHSLVATWKIDAAHDASSLTVWPELDANLFDVSNPINAGYAYAFSNAGRFWLDLRDGTLVPDTQTLPDPGLFDLRAPILTDKVLGLSLSDQQSNFSIYLSGNVPQAVPEPATLAVLGLGAVAAFRRKRP